MEHTTIKGVEAKASRVALGTWAIGGWMWGGTDEAASIRTIHAALDKGVNVVDTAPVYGFGTSEEIVGKALAQDGRRDGVILSTKVGLDFDPEKNRVWRDSSPERLRQEVEDSLRRLRTDHLDVYFVHWPDPLTPHAETAETLQRLQQEGKIGAIGVSNHGPEQMDRFRQGAELAINQPPYNLLERGIEADVLPYCQQHQVAVMAYGALCRGLLSGKMTAEREFPGDDLRQFDPKFRGERYAQYLTAVDRLDGYAREKHDRRVIHLAVRFVLDQGVDIALWGGRRPEQMDPLPEMFGWQLDDEDRAQLDRILSATITDPVGPEFMAPPDAEGRTPEQDA